MAVRASPDAEASAFAQEGLEATYAFEGEQAGQFKIRALGSLLIGIARVRRERFVPGTSCLLVSPGVARFEFAGESIGELQRIGFLLSPAFVDVAKVVGRNEIRCDQLAVPPQGMPGAEGVPEMLALLGTRARSIQVERHGKLLDAVIHGSGARVEMPAPKGAGI